MRTVSLEFSTLQRMVVAMENSHGGGISTATRFNTVAQGRPEGKKVSGTVFLPFLRGGKKVSGTNGTAAGFWVL